MMNNIVLLYEVSIITIVYSIIEWYIYYEGYYSKNVRVNSKIPDVSSGK